MLKTRAHVFAFGFGLLFLIVAVGVYAAYTVTVEQRAARSMNLEGKTDAE